jgi:hypothetical protein
VFDIGLAGGKTVIYPANPPVWDYDTHYGGLTGNPLEIKCAFYFKNLIEYLPTHPTNHSLPF